MGILQIKKKAGEFSEKNSVQSLSVDSSPESNLQKSTQLKAPESENITSAEDHLLTEEGFASSWSMGSPAGLSLSSCSRSVTGSDAQRFNVMSYVCLPPGDAEASRTLHRPAGWLAQIILPEIHR